MNFKACNRSQSLLLPPSYEAFLGESHEAVVLAEFIDNLDLASLEAGYGNEHGGRSAYHPVMLLTVLIYGYMNGAFSSRKIAKCLRQDLAFMYLAGNNTPDFRTLARFRKEQGDGLTAVFKEVVTKARELGFISFGTVSLDGTKIHASASRAKNETQDALEQKIRDLVNEAERVDAMEDEQYGDHEDEEADELKTKEGRTKKRQELAKKHGQAEGHLKILANRASASSKDAKVNTTDPAARLMKMKRGDFANGYNVQILTENGMILTSHIADTSADQRLLVPTVQAFQTMHDVRPRRLLADKGYSGELNYRFCERNRIDAYIPVHQEPVDLTTYVYDKATNTHTDAEGRMYRFKQRMDRQGCKSMVYEHIDAITGKKKYLSIAHEWHRHVRKQKKKFASLQGKEIYKQRMSDVEGAFANIKHNLRFTAFRLRGFTGVANEWNLISLAHNLKKML